MGSLTHKSKRVRVAKVKQSPSRHSHPTPAASSRSVERTPPKAGPIQDELKEIRDPLALVRATATIAEIALRTRTTDFVAIEAAAVLRRYVVSEVDKLVVRLNDVIIFALGKERTP